MPGEPQFTWDLVADLRQLFEFPFMVNAFRAGTIVAIVAAVIGWFMVLRREAFVGHTLALVGFPGASAAVLLGVTASLGYLVFALGAALVIAGVGYAGSVGRGEESAVVGTVQAFALATGFLFVSLGHQNVTSAQALLFGSFLGITDTEVVTLLIGGTVALLAVGVMARPLLFASLDPDVAAARGVPVRALSIAFLVLLGIAAAEASQVTGSLLVFALLVIPAATAESLTARPPLSIALAVAIALGVTWVGLATSYYTDLPIGFLITTLAFAAYLLSHAGRLLPRGAPTVATSR